MRSASIVAFLGVAHAAYDKCNRPVAQWAGVNQAHGNGYVYGAKYHAGSLFSAGYQAGDYAFHSNHIINGATGSHGTNHSSVQVVHATGSHDDPDPDTGVMDPSPSAQNGWDAVVTKISDAGVFEGIFAVDTMPVDGKYDDTSLNSDWGGYSYLTNLDDFAASGDNDNMVAMGSFRGKLTFPTAAGAAPVTLENRKWKRYDGFLTKFNANTLEVVWATGEKIQRPTCNTNTDGTPDEDCDEPTSLGGRVATTSEGHVVATSNYGDAAGGRTSNGRLLLFNGQTGANVWDKDFGAGNQLYATETIGTKAYVVGTIDGVGIDPFDTGTAKDYADSAVVAAIDVSAASPGATHWAVTFGQGTGYSIVANPAGTHLYVAGSLDEAPTSNDPVYTIGACSLTGKYGGFLMKLKAADGECVWATDTPRVGGTRGRDHGLAVDAADTFVYTVTDSSSAKVFDDTHTIYPQNSDGFLAKFSAANGVGEWVDNIGGQGNDYITDVVTSPDGVLVAGYTKSKTVKLGDAEILNLQHMRADGDGSGSSGYYAHFAMMIHAEAQTVSCIETCTTDRTTAVLKPGFCLIGNACVANGAAPAFSPCFDCQTSVSTRALQGPNYDNHCFFDGKCVAAGAGAPHYTSYNSYSVCEICQPAVDTADWSIKPNYFHDREHANDECWAPTRTKGGFNAEPGPCKPNNYGILFQRNSGGCQELPDVPLPATPSATLAAALAAPTSGAVADIGARAIKAISETNTATTVDGTQLVSAWYHANQATCNGASGFEVDHDENPATPKHKTGACKNTPAAHADEMASLFGTSMYYGHSVARIKVQQALAILDDDFKTGTVTAVKDDMKKDIVAHILVPMYQGAIKAAYDMDNGGKAAARDAGLAYWNLIHPNVPGFHAADKARLVALFGPSASGANNNYCEVKAILHRNLPDGSMLQYGQQTHQTMGGTRDDNNRPLHHASGLPTASLFHVPETSGRENNQPKPISGELGVPSETEAVEGVHIKERDIGTLKGSEEVVCTYPPPSPPPPSPALPKTADSNSGLTDGEIAGVAIGAAVGGIVLLGVVGLILRSIMFKEAKPVFTCLEKAPAKSPA